MTALTGITYAAACNDPALFGPWFEGKSWTTWRVLDKALFGLPLDTDELAIFHELTGHEEAPTEPAEEAWLICGRRSAKTVKAASLGTYLGTIGPEQYGWRERLTRGERGVVQILAVDRAQARVGLNYIRAFFEQPLLAPLVERETQDGIELRNGFAIEVATNDKRRVRGRTVCAAIFEEVAHWRSEESISPDEETYRAVKPAMATIPNSLLIGISSPYSRRGLLFRKFSAHYGKAGPILIVKAPTIVMNPSVDRKVIDDAYAADPIAAAAEYGAEFRGDVETFLTVEAIRACIQPGVRERPPERQHHYVGFVDPSGGSADAFTLAIAHAEGDHEQRTAILDLVREVKPPFSPEGVTQEFADTLRSYRITKVHGDRYAGEWPREQFRKHGVNYEPSDRNKSEIYIDLLPLINSRGVDLLDHDRIVNQLIGLERRTARGGRDSIDHAPGAHDDLANAVAGALTLANRKSSGLQRREGPIKVLNRPASACWSPPDVQWVN